MAQVNGSRRALLGGVAGVLGVAILGRLALVRHTAENSVGEGIRVVRGTDTAIAGQAAAAHGEWAQRIGESFRFTADAGAFPATLLAVQAVPTRGVLPAGVRQQAFTLFFAVDRASAPATDAVITVDRAIEGVTRLFVTRGNDRDGQAVLMALFD